MFLYGALGISLPGNAAIPAADARRKVMAHLTGRRIVEMVEADLKPSDILTRAAFLNAIKVKEMRVFFSTNNLLTFTNYRGFDPEIGTAGWILDTGIDKGFYPSNKSFGGGVKITF